MDLSVSAGDLAGLVRHATLGINSLKIYRYERGESDKFGSVDAIIGDCRTLGAAFIRLPDGADLRWPPNLEVPVDDADIYQALYDESRDSLAALFDRLDGSGVKVVLTFLTLGGAANVYNDSAHPDPRAEVDLNATSLLWAAGHFGNVVADLDGNDGVTINETDMTWAFNTLDPRSAYKITYVYRIARQVAQLLLDLEDEGVHVFRNIQAIAMLNELNNADVHTMLTDGAEPWADALVAAVQGFTEVLGAELPTLWWPAIGSSTERQPFSEIQDFLEQMISYAQLLATSRGVDLSVLANQDYHWFHYAPFQDARIPILTLRDDLDAIRSVFSDAGLEATVSVCETGITASVREAYADAFSSVDTQDETEMELLQAQDVWRRVATALCCGTVHVAWHTLVAETDGSYPGTGLREDGAEITVSGDAVPRLSYWTFQRLATHTSQVDTTNLFRLIPVANRAHGRIVYPPSRRSAASLDVSDPEDMVVILHFRNCHMAAHVYVIFMDAVADRGSAAIVTIYDDSGVALVSTHQSVPSALGAPVASAVAGEFGRRAPDSDWQSELSLYIGLPIGITVQVGDDPILLHSDSLLSFEVTS